MVRIVDCNIMDSKSEIIAHQVNCMGVMGGGVAKQIKNMYPEAYNGYKAALSQYKSLGESPLGKVNFCFIHDKAEGDASYIANMFGQYNYGTSERQTDYGALRSCLETLAAFAKAGNASVSIPYKLGCGLGGGDWEHVVYPMILETMAGVDVTICRL